MRQWFHALAVCFILFGIQPKTPISVATISLPDDPDQESRESNIVDAMSPEQRVGQLFVVTFDGPAASLESGVDGG